MLDGTLFIGVVIGAVLIGIAGVCFAPLFLRLNLAWAYDNGARLFDVFECWFGAVCFEIPLFVDDFCPMFGDPFIDFISFVLFISLLLLLDDAGTFCP